ncbi:hypothetical protein B296_00028798 [Ensete ventricosum]|uniref:Uncharacterized protein n=1 Tax=Ensete ventricosum TaxID=4639 RepID=A0A426Z7X7_ENSVE|nr:hypothetical protein B296_00028798 [Ensete ventricosum]
MIINLKKGANASAGAKFDNPIRSDYHAPARSSSCKGPTAGAIDRSEGQREKRCDGVGKVPLLVGAYAIVVVHKEDGLVQKNVSVEELRKPTWSNGGRES